MVILIHLLTISPKICLFKIRSTMPNEILDSPTRGNFQKIRKPYTSILEYIILITNGIFIVLGVFICWSIALTEENWLFLINPTVFVLLFGIPPFHFVYKWRKASQEYEITQNTNLLKPLSSHVAIFLAPVILGLWILIFLFLSSFFFALTEFDSNATQGNSLFLWRLMVLFLLIALGPIQFFFIRNTNKISQKLLRQQPT